jgi:HD-GYP domain-containing protein (c-di-GMP phosphodiesterase class II)
VQPVGAWAPCMLRASRAPRALVLHHRLERADIPAVRVSVLPDHRAEGIRVSDVLAALSFALDLADGQPAGHSLRTTLIGMDLADRLDLGLQDRRDLYYALMLKDVGCSSTSARLFDVFGGDDRVAQRRLLRPDWHGWLKAVRFHFAYAPSGQLWPERLRRAMRLVRDGSRLAGELVETRARRGQEIVRQLRFSDRVAGAVGSVDERWDGSGLPQGLVGSGIPVLSRVIAVAQFVEVHATVYGARRAIEAARHHRGRWLDPQLVDATRDLESELGRWCALDEEALRREVREVEPGDAALLAGPDTLNCIARGFADVVDAKSPYTAQHSSRVCEYALAIADRLGFEPAERNELHRAALLHDIGKLSVPNSILDKPGPLDPDDWEVVKLHPFYTQRILEHIRGFEELAKVAAFHHERLDGRGYFHGLREDQIPLSSQVIAAADIFDALTTERPYRPAWPEEVALRHMETDRGTGLRPDCLDALIDALEEGVAIPARRAA